jgi:hypothetical protein
MAEPRIFSIRRIPFTVPHAQSFHFTWLPAFDWEVGVQLSYQQQFLEFFRFLIHNIESVPEKNQDWAPLALSLSLRAGAVKTYVIAAASMVEGVLLEILFRRKMLERDSATRMTFGRVLDVIDKNAELKAEFADVWDRLQLLKQYRNFVHLANAAKNEQAYWMDVANREQELFNACDSVIAWLEAKMKAENGH